jgi:hypothetical protein
MERQSVEVGQVIELNEARVISAKMDYDLYNKYPRSVMKVMLEDSRFGKIWFKTAAKFAYDLANNDLLSCLVTVSGIKEEIIFGKYPKNTIIK